MKTYEDLRQVRDNTETFKAGLDYETISQTFSISQMFVNPSSENRNNMGQLQTYKDMAKSPRCDQEAYKRQQVMKGNNK